MKKIVVILMLGIFLISFASAAEWDNVKYKKDMTFNGKNISGNELLEKYRPIEIKNALGFGKTLVEGYISQHDEVCGVNCTSTMEIKLHQKGVLIQDVIFETLQKDGSWIKQDVRSYQFKANGNEYIVGNDVEAGVYTVQLKAERNPSRIIDWKIVTSGKIIDEWAIWGSNRVANESHGVTLGSSGPGNDQLGGRITVDIRPMTILNLTVHSLSTPTKAILKHNNGTIIQNTTTKTGDTFTFPTLTTLDANTSYRIEFDADGASFTSRWGGVTNLSGTYINWTTGSANGVDNVNFYNMVSMWVNVSGGVIVLNSPEDNNVTVSTDIEFNATATILSGATLVNRSLNVWYSNGTLLGVNSTTGLSGSTETSLDKISGLVLDEEYLWNKEYCDSDDECGFSDFNNSFSTDGGSPTIEVESPTGEIEFGFIGRLETLNVTINDTNLGTCWFDYNGTNITIEGCTSGIKNSTTFAIEENNFNMTIYANDSLGQENSTFINWTYDVFRNSETFSSTTVMGSTEEFKINVTVAQGRTITVASIFYNETPTLGTIDTTTEPNNTLISASLIIPRVTSDINLSFNWLFLLSDLNLSNSTTNNQTVSLIQIDNCTVFTNVILNLTMVDEELQTILENTTLEIAINIFSQDRTTLILNVSDTYFTNPTGICLSTTLASSTNYSLDLIARYEADAYAIEYHNIVNSLLLSSSETQNLTLFDLNLTDSTDFQLTFKGLDFLPEEDVLIFVDRQYISENTFKTVELPKTDSNGQTILHLVRNDVVYNLRAVKDGQVLGNLVNIIAFCDDFTIGSCTISFNAISNETAIFNYDSEIGILYQSAPTYDSTTNRVSFDFISSDGVAKAVLMTVERRDVFGNLTVCENTLVSTSGVVSCDIGLDLTDTSLFTTISINNTGWITSNVIIDTSAFGNIGIVMWFILALSLLLMFTESKNGILISIIFTYVGGIGLGWSIGGITGIGSAGIWVLVMTIVGIWKLNKNKKS